MTLEFELENAQAILLDLDWFDDTLDLDLETFGLTYWT